MRIRFPLAFLVLSALLAIGTASPLAAQDEPVPSLDPETGEEVVDRVAAVVGDSVVLYSEVVERLQQQRAQLEAVGEPFPTDPEAVQALEAELLDELIQTQLLLQAAATDTMVAVTDEQVDRAFDEEWQSRVNQLGGEDNLREALTQQGLSVAGFRSTLREQIRREGLIEQFIQLQQRDAGMIVVDESEVEEYFESQRATFPERPASLTVRQAIIEPPPSEEAMAEAHAEVERILELMQEGEEFEELARRLSDDPGSAQEGGELGWFRRASELEEEFGEEFEDAAFSLREGQVTGPVETNRGAHIIQVDRIRGPERRIRHILIAAEGDQEAARARAQEIHDGVASGTPMEEFERESASSEIINTQVVNPDSLQAYPSAYSNAIRSAEEGDLIGPIELPLDEGGARSAWAVVQVTELREAGEFTLDDLRADIRDFLRNQEFMTRLMDRLRARTHIDIRI